MWYAEFTPRKRVPDREKGGRERMGLNATAVEHPHPCKRRNYSNYIARVLRQRFFPPPSSIPALFFASALFSLFLSLSSPLFSLSPFLVHDSQITGFREHRDDSSLCQRSRMYRSSSFSSRGKISILLSRKAITQFTFLFLSSHLQQKVFS